MKRFGTAFGFFCVFAMAVFGGLLLFAPSSRSVAEENRLTEAQQWALATPAIVKKLNGMPLDVLGGGQADPDYEASVKEMLAGDWNISDKKGALETLQWLRDEGHRKEYDAMAAEVAKCDDKAFAELVEANADQPEVQAQLKFVREHAAGTGTHGILAWDYCRLVYLAECAFRAGYITEDEAWDFIMPAARVMQQRFASWGEMGDNYLLGREFWNGSPAAEFAETKKELVTHPESLWVTLPWNLPLGGAKQ